MTTHDSPNPGVAEERPASDVINIPGDFPASFTVDELIEVGEDENWNLINFDAIQEDPSLGWDLAYETPGGVTIIINSQPNPDADTKTRNVKLFAGRVHVTEYDVYESITDRFTGLPNTSVRVRLPETIADKIDHTPGEPLSESQFNELFTVTEWPHDPDSDTTIDTLTVGLDSRHYLDDITLEELQNAVTVLEGIRSDYEAKLEKNK